MYIEFIKENIFQPQEVSGQMKRLETRGYLSARGYFTVGRGLITSVFGTSITYMVILIEFWENTTQSRL